MVSWTETVNTSLSSAAASVGAGQTLVDGWIDVTGNVWSGTNIAADTSGAYYLASVAGSTNVWETGPLYRPASEDSASQRLTAQVNLSTSQNFYFLLRSNRSTTAFNGYLASIDWHSNGGFYFHAYLVVANKLTQICAQSLSTQPTAGSVVTFDAQLIQVTSTTSQLILTATDANGNILGTYDSGAANATVNNASLQGVTGSVGVAAYSPSSSNAAGIKTFSVYNGDSSAPSATTFSMTGPSAVTVGTESDYTVKPDAAPTADVVVTLSDNNGGGAFDPGTVTMPAGSVAAQTFGYLARSAGTKTISATNNGSLANPANLSVVASTAVTPPTKITLDLSSSTVQAGGVINATFELDYPAVTPVTITPQTVGGAGSFSPATLTIAAGATSATTQWTAPTSAGSVTMGCKNGSSLTNDPGQTITVVAAVTPPSAPSFTLQAGNGQVVVNVQASSSNGGAAITGYPIYVGTSAGGEAASPVTTLTGAGSYTLAGLTNGNPVYVKVGATNSAGTSVAAEQTATPVAPAAGNIIPVNSPAFLFSPGNWYGDTGRGGSLWRHTWNVGAYFVFTFNASGSPTATINTGPAGTGAWLALFVNGAESWVQAGGDITVSNLNANTQNVIFGVLYQTPQSARWGQGANSLTITGITLDASSTAGTTTAGSKGWIKLVGDSITEGINSGGTNKPDFTQAYTFAVLIALRAEGYEVCVSVCGYSGYLDTGDSGADVPAYYFVSGSINGAGGTYNDAQSRWNKIDSGVSALDSAGRLSAYGDTGEEPVGIMVNYLTNEALGKLSTSDCQAAMQQCMIAHRSAAPDAWLFQMIPVGFHYSGKYNPAYLAAFNAAYASYQALFPSDTKTAVIDIGADLSVAIETNTGSLINTDQVHPLAKGHALITPAVSSAIMKALEGKKGRSFVFRHVS
ncbi:MAG: hypothetical protein ABF968_04855 [Acetobacter sp.]|uniref:hypothetical protein n=1 Tax=Acetobacter sp. TaxID=440 RepID=UPI0039EB834C